MTTLTKYSNFKSLKGNSSKVKNNTTAPQKAEAEMLSFLSLISKAKAKVKKG